MSGNKLSVVRQVDCLLLSRKANLSRFYLPADTYHKARRLLVKVQNNPDVSTFETTVDEEVTGRTPQRKKARTAPAREPLRRYSSSSASSSSSVSIDEQRPRTPFYNGNYSMNQNLCFTFDLLQKLPSRRSSLEAKS